MPKPLLSETIQRHWRQIVDLVTENQPECGEDLYSGAPGQYLAHLEWYVQQPLPEELRALYRLNNGQGRLGQGFSVKMFSGGLFEGHYFLPLGGVAQIWQRLASHPERRRQGSNHWIPFARDQQGTSVLCIDMNERTRDLPGRVIEVSVDTGAVEVLAPNLISYLEQLARQVMWLKRQRSGWQGSPVRQGLRIKAG